MDTVKKERIFFLIFLPLKYFLKMKDERRKLKKIDVKECNIENRFATE